MLFQLLLSVAAATAVFGCPDHTGLRPRSLSKRAVVSPTDPSFIRNDWAYDASFNWGAIKPEYATCQNGTQQSPIDVPLRSPSTTHKPTFRGYNKKITGNWTNWGYGPAFTPYRPEGEITSLPSLKWDEETAYLIGWHIHAPSEHLVAGNRSRAEMHFVHANAEGEETAVLAIRLDPGDGRDVAFFKQLPPYVGFEQNGVASEVVPNVSLVIEPILRAVGGFKEYWSYTGSLTTPPCREGLRWFVASEVPLLSTKQLQALLGVSTYSARVTQELWRHDFS